MRASRLECSYQTVSSKFENKLARIQSLEPRTLFSAAPAITPAELVAQANNAFTFDLLHQLAPDSSGNTFFSPYSADTALEMALQGAKGVTANEMIQALHLPSADLAQAGIAALNQLFQATAATDGYTLSTANRLWVNNNDALLDSFIAASSNTFGSAPQSVDFSDPQAAANTINTWVSGKTNGKITNLISPGAVSALTALVITNAIYFKGSWTSPFDAALTQSATFQIASTEAATVQMMRQAGELGYYAESGVDGFQAVDLPYVGNNLDMLVILPTTYDVNSFESTLTPALFSQITSNLSPSEVDVRLPKFELNETYDLKSPLENLGIQSAFSVAADFSGISNQPVKVSDVVQKSFISVDEAGTEAAAATAVIAIDAVVLPRETPISFDANHPFMIAIRDRSTNTILFLGSVADPTGGAADFVTPATPLSDPVTATSKVASPPGTGIIIDPMLLPTSTPLSLKGIANRTFNGTLGVLHNVTSHAPKLADLSGTVEWGDGSSSIAHFARIGNKTIAIHGSHTYADAGSYTITLADLTVTPYAKGKPTNGPIALMPEMGATIAIAAPRASAVQTGLSISATAGKPFTATLADVNLPDLPTGATRGVIIHWGNGSTSAGTLAANGADFDISGSHLYRSAGHFHVLIDVWQKSHGQHTALARMKSIVTVTAS